MLNWLSSFNHEADIKTCLSKGLLFALYVPIYLFQGGMDWLNLSWEIKLLDSFTLQGVTPGFSWQWRPVKWNLLCVPASCLCPPLPSSTICVIKLCSAADKRRVQVNLENIMHNLSILFLTPNTQDSYKPWACYFSCQSNETNNQEVQVILDYWRQSSLAGHLNRYMSMFKLIFYKWTSSK